MSTAEIQARPLDLDDLAASLPARNLRTLASNAAMVGDFLGSEIAQAAADAPKAGPESGPRRRVISFCRTGAWDLDLEPIRVVTSDGTRRGEVFRLERGALHVRFDDSPGLACAVDLRDLLIVE